MTMDYGLILSDPAGDQEKRRAAERLLAAQQIPLAGFTQEEAALFGTVSDRNAFLRRAAWVLMRPGEPLPINAVLAHLNADALPGNVLRRCIFLQLSLLPYLRANAKVTQGEGCFLLGDDLLVAPVSEEGTVEAVLPPGQWTDLQDGQVWAGRLRLMRGYNAMPVLARENALIPIGVEDRRSDGDDADRVTLHWYQPGGEARCALADGTAYNVSMRDGVPVMITNSQKAWHMILHLDGQEHLIR